MKTSALGTSSCSVSVRCSNLVTFLISTEFSRRRTFWKFHHNLGEHRMVFFSGVLSLLWFWDKLHDSTSGSNYFAVSAQTTSTFVQMWKRTDGAFQMLLVYESYDLNIICTLMLYFKVCWMFRNLKYLYSNCDLFHKTY